MSEKKLILIIAEKPNQGINIANALSLEEEIMNINMRGETHKVKIFRGEYDNDEIVLVPAKGHIMELRGKSSNILFFDFKWKNPTMKKKDHLARYMILKKTIEDGVDEIVIATDADDQGELIGYTIVEHFDVIDKTSRMIFQSMTERALQESYDNRGELRINIALAQEFRTWSDKVFGYIFSKILTNSYKKVTGARYIKLPVGRVMTPTLMKVIENMEKIKDEEEKVKLHKPKIKISFELRCQIPSIDDSFVSIPINEEDYDISMNEAIKLKKKYDELVGKIIRKYDEEVKIEQPSSGITIDDIREWGYKKGIEFVRTDGILEALYLSKLITYPRSDSTVLPNPEHGDVDDDYYESIIDNAIEYFGITEYKDKIINKKIPNMGDEYDGAHWGIHPTEEKVYYELPTDYKMIYDYILRNFLKGFGFPKKETFYKCVTEFSFQDGKKEEIIKTYWSIVNEYGYEVFDNFSILNYEEPDSNLIPEVNVDDEIKCHSVIDKYTKFQNISDRITKEKLYKFMKRKNLGTDATRSMILEKLWSGNLVRGDPPFITILGLRIIDAILEINPELTKISLTKHFNEMCDSIINGNKTVKELKEAIKEEIKEIVKEKINDLEIIGNKIAFFGECKVCKSKMKLISWSKGNSSYFFLACVKDDCDFTSPI